MSGRERNPEGAVAALDAIADDFRDSVLDHSARVAWPILGLLATSSAVLKDSLVGLIGLEKLADVANPLAPLVSPERSGDVRRLHQVLLAHLVIQFFNAVDSGENRDRFGKMLDCDPDEVEDRVLAELADFQDVITWELSTELLAVWDTGDSRRYADVTYNTALIAAGIIDRLNAPTSAVMVVMDALGDAVRTLDDEFWQAMAAVRED